MAPQMNLDIVKYTIWV